MSKKKQKPILSDRIAELIAPTRRLLDPEIDSEDETAARAIDHDLDDDFDETEPVRGLSDIRRKNVKLLHDVDAKYRGKVTSRKDLDMDFHDEDDSEDVEGSDEEVEHEEDSNESEYEENSTEKSIGEFKMMLTPKQRIKLAQQDNESEEEDGAGGAVSSEDDDDEIKSFAMKLKGTKSTKNEAESESDDDDLPTNDQEELEKWDDDYEGEEIEEEESENEGGSDENDNDDDEDFDDDEEEGDEDDSDFDGGDIIPKAPSDQGETSQKPDLSRILPKQRTDDHLSKGVCVQNQLQIWEKLLEVRIHSQKMLIKANSLPQPQKYEQLIEKSADFAELANETEVSVSKLVSQMRDLQSLLLNQYTETKELAAKRKPLKIDDIVGSDAKRSRLEHQLEKDYSDFKGYQYSVISKWHDRTKVLTPGSIKTQKQQGNIDILRKIEGVLANRADLIKKSQTLKGGYELFDKSTGTAESKPTGMLVESNQNDTENGDEDSEIIHCPEIYDDTDFYHTQLRELIEYKTSSSNNANEMAKQFTELQKLRKKMKKTVDTRASKGRKIRYVVHNKLVSFMAPNDPGAWNDEQKNELYKSLFGAQT